MTGRGAANFLTRMTAYLAAAFFATSIGLTLLANQASKGRSVFDTPAATVPAGPQPAGAPAAGTPPTDSGAPAAPARGGILDKLQPPGSTPAPSPAPAAPTVPKGQ